MTFDIKGPAEIAAVDNGNAASLESFQADHRQAFNGMCMVYIRSLQETGAVTLSASSEGLVSTTVKLNMTE